VKLLGRGFAWLDTGTHDSLIQAGELIRTLEQRQGLRIGCLEEIAYSQGWIDKGQLAALGRAQGKSEYGQYLQLLASGALSADELAE
jgi:glucose-1-phosphate thymidylyltransferase